ncbi:hypothetical protein [Streptomyces zingiberis]|uniref:hypothetical protein n=1 Tax=Streptomyces zingiberis TaxID=2053010 RepID=UPI0019D16149|nr:hypothetical protein [Streptomyces zingiberis]
MKKHVTRLGLTALVAALALTGAGPAAQALDGAGTDGASAPADAGGRPGGPTVVVEGDNNQVVIGNENVTGRDGIVASGDSNTGGIGGGETAPAQPYGTVVASQLNVRSGPGTTYSILPPALAYGQQVGLICKVVGQNVDGNNLWYLLRDRPGYAAARYVQNTGTVPYCQGGIGPVETGTLAGDAATAPEGGDSAAVG